MTVARYAILALSTLLLAGCINSTALVKVKPDGSGTIEQTMLVNAAALKGFMAGRGGGQVKSSGILDEAEFKRAAERMGVRPVSLTPMNDGGFEGAKAVFAFDDISKVRLDQDPQMTGTPAGKLTGGGSPIKFAVARQGTSSVLTISVDEKTVANATEKAQAAPSMEGIDPAMLQMIKTMFNGFHLLIDVEVDGRIVKTNADYVNGSRITLLELDADDVFEDEANLKGLQSKLRPGMSLAELRPYLKSIKGVKVNHPTVTIEYR